MTPCRSNAAGFVGNGCVGEYHSPGTLPWGVGFSSIGQTGLPLVRSKTKVNADLFTCARALIFLPSTVMSSRIGAAGNIVIPHLVMDQLVIPDALAGLRIETNEAVGKQIGAGALAAVSIAAGRFDRNVDVAEFFVAGEGSPGAGVAGELPGFSRRWRDP